MKLVASQRTTAALSILYDAAVIALLLGIRWRAQYRAEPPDGLPGAEALPDWWWKLGSAADWLLYPGADSGLYAMNVRRMLDGAVLDFHRPPLITKLTGWATPLFGDLVFAGHMVNHLFSALVCVAIYAFGRSSSGRGAAAGAALLTAYSPQLLASKADFGVDATLQFSFVLVAAATLFAIRGSWGRWIVAGVACGLAASGHLIAFALVVPSAMLVLLHGGDKNRSRYGYAAPLVVLAVAFVVWKLMLVGYPPTTIPQTLMKYTEAVRSFNPETTAGESVTVLGSMLGFVGNLLRNPLESLRQLVRPLQSVLSLPWPLLLPLCLLGVLGPGLQTWSSPRARLARDREGTEGAGTIHDGEPRPGLAVHVRRASGWDWRPALWLSMFLAPLVLATSGNAPERYLLCCFPFLYLAAMRGFASLAAGFEHRALAAVRGWPRGLLAFVVCGLVVLLIGPDRSVEEQVPGHLAPGVLQRLAGERIQADLDGGDCLLTGTPEIGFFAGGADWVSPLCPEPGDRGMRRCFAQFLEALPRCDGDLVYTLEPDKDQGPFIEPNRRMDGFVERNFAVAATVTHGDRSVLLYRMDRDLLLAVVGGAPMPPYPGADDGWE